MTDHPPLWIMCRRLAPFVARGDIGLTEATDCIMQHIIRERWSEFGDQLNLTEEWITNMLSREAERYE